MPTDSFIAIGIGAMKTLLSDKYSLLAQTRDYTIMALAAVNLALLLSLTSTAQAYLKYYHSISVCANRLEMPEQLSDQTEHEKPALGLLMESGQANKDSTNDPKVAARCERINKRIDWLNSRLRAGYRVKQGERWKQELRDLKKERREKC